MMIIDNSADGNLRRSEVRMREEEIMDALTSTSLCALSLLIQSGSSYSSFCCSALFLDVSDSAVRLQVWSP